jgi:glycosyltransferase involved in cell wall biosynthesis
MPKVSVVIPIYNAGIKLHKCIKSVLNQTFKDFQLLLVNDGSTDQSLKICKKYQILDGRIMVINKENEGSIATRKKGVMASFTKYVMFVDADDWIEPNTIEVLYNEAIQNDLDIAVCNINRVVGSGLFIKSKCKSWYFKNNKLYDELEIKKNLVTAYFFGHPFPSSLCAKLYKRELLINTGNYLNKIHFFGDDLFYNLEMLLLAKKIKMIDKHLYNYRYGGFTSRYQPHLFDDMVNGYLIQTEVIDSYYNDTKEKNYRGISIMLLNTFKACLVNLFSSPLEEEEIKNKIKSYINHKTVIKCVLNAGSEKYFTTEYLEAFKNEDIDFLYNLGRTMHKKSKVKKLLINFVSKIS